MGDLRKMLNPKTVALVGASEKEGSIGLRILSNLGRSFNGSIFPINPTRQKVLDRECYPSVSAVQERIDLGVVAVPAGHVSEIVEECGRVGVEGVVVISTGFRERGKAGLQLEYQIRESTKKYGLRIVGPGSLGIIRPDIGLNTTFFSANPEPGNIAFISQSGELGEPLLEWGIQADIGFSMFTSLGSMIDVDFGDIIDFLGDDFTTRSILLNMEYVGNARKFMSAGVCAQQAYHYSETGQV